MKTLLDVDYVIRDEKAVVRLFYREDNERKTEEVKDFEPYFYAIPSRDIEKLAEKVKELENVVKVNGKKMIDTGREIDVLEVVVKIPPNVPEVRGNVKDLEECSEVREAGIPFARRFLINSNLSPTTSHN